MATTINSNTTDGLVITPDTSGDLKFQSNGTDVLTIDSSGNPTFTGQIASANLPDLKTIDGNSIVGTGDIDLKTINSNSIVGTGNIEVGGGKVLQVVQTVKTDVYTSTVANSWGDVTGLSCTITPSSTSSKILCLVHVNGGGTPGQVAARMRFLRGGTVIYQGDASGTRTRGIGQNAGGDLAFNGTAIVMYLDSPATTSATTYKIQRHAENTNLFCVNRTIRDADGNDCRSASSITLMEIAG